MGSACGGEEEADIDADTEDATGNRAPGGLQDGVYLDKGDGPHFADSDSGSSSDSDSPSPGKDDDETDGNKQEAYKFTVSDTTLKGFRSAVQEGNDSLVRFYIIEYPDNNFLRVVWENGDSPLHVAVKRKSQNTAEFLLKEGMNANVQNVNTLETPLHYAVEERAGDICELLLSYGADAQAMSKTFITPIEMATEYDYYEIVHMLKQHAMQMPKFSGGDPDDEYSDEDSSEDEGSVDSRLEKDRAAQMNKPEPSQDLDDLEPPKKTEHSKSASISLETKFKKQMSADDVVQMKAMKVVRTNPFTKIHLIRSKTVDVEHKARKLAKLPQMAAFLMKRTPRPPYVYNKRWAQVTETHFFWSETMIGTHNFKGAKPSIDELKRFKGYVRLDQIVGVDVLEKSKKQNKFTMTMNAKSKRYSGERTIIWKCQSEEDRDFWIKGLRDYVTWYNKTDDYFE